MKEQERYRVSRKRALLKYINFTPNLLSSNSINS